MANYQKNRQQPHLSSKDITIVPYMFSLSVSYKQSFTHILIICIIFTLIFPANSTNSLRIYDKDNNTIFPFSISSQGTSFECALSHSIYFKQKQVFYVEYNKPFILMVSSEKEDIKMSGMSQSDQQIKEAGQKYISQIIIRRQCSSIFGQTEYQTTLDMYTKSDEGDIKQDSQYIDISGSNFSTYKKQSFSIPSHTYCLSSRQLISLRNFFDYGYTFLCAMVISMVPTFPAQSVQIRNLYILFLVFAIFLVEYSWKYLFLFHISLIIWFLIVFSRKYYHPLLNPQPTTINDRFQMTLEHQKAFKMSNNSFTSLFWIFVILIICLGLFKPDYEKVKGKIDEESGETSTIVHTPNLIYTLILYIYNICLNILITQIFCGVFWFNRLRHVFFWFTLVHFYIIIFQMDGFEMFTYEVKSNIAVDETQKISSLSTVGLNRLLLPIIYSQSCRYRSMIFFTLLMPIAQFLDRFLQLKTTGVMMMMTMVMVSGYSPLLGFWVCFAQFLCWLAVIIYRNGYYNTFTMRWIKKKSQSLFN